MAIEALICDFGGVLTSPLHEAFASVQEHSGIPALAMASAMARMAQADGKHPLYELETGRVKEADFLERVGRELRQDLGREVAMHEFSDGFWAALRTNDPMVELVAAVRARGIRTAMLTNNVREWEPRWRAMLAVDDLFELVVDSGFEGVRKPDPRIYEITLQRLGLPASSCLFLDDVDINCDAARELGMNVVWFRDNDQAIADVEAALT